ncbi:MAG: YwaF family protein [Planctomycetota bacterium]
MIHWLTLAMSIGLGALCGALHRGGAPTCRTAIRLGLAALAIAVAVGHHAYWLGGGRFDWSKSLPLHYCDLATILAPVSLLIPRARLLRAVVIGWGLGLTPLAFVVPVVAEDAEPLRTFFYLASHGIVVSVAAYHLLAQRLRFTRADLWRALGFTWAYGLGTVLLNWETGFGYGYTGPAADPAWLSRLGPWPVRLVPIALIAGGLLVGLYLGIAAAHKFAKR